jgi:hypothetical protein
MGFRPIVEVGVAGAGTQLPLDQVGAEAGDERDLSIASARQQVGDPSRMGRPPTGSRGLGTA